MAVEEIDQTNVHHEMRALIEEYRHRCLWFLRPDFVPSTTEEQDRVLDLIVRHGDRRAYERVAEIRRWLSHPSSDES